MVYVGCDGISMWKKISEHAGYYVSTTEKTNVGNLYKTMKVTSSVARVEYTALNQQSSALYFNYRLVIPAFKASWQPIRREVI